MYTRKGYFFSQKIFGIDYQVLMNFVRTAKGNIGRVTFIQKEITFSNTKIRKDGRTGKIILYVVHSEDHNFPHRKADTIQNPE